MESGAHPTDSPREAGRVRAAQSPRARLDDRSVAALWQEYKENASPEARELLILQYAPLVKLAAGHMVDWPQQVDRTDLVSFGLFGLIDAIEKFDPGRGFKFETYAITRIKGAIIDELRSLDLVPRRVRADARAIAAVRVALEHELCRAPTHAEISTALGVRRDQFERARSEIAFANVTSLEKPVARSRGGQTSARLADTIADPADHFESLVIAQNLASAIATLPERDRLMLTLYYFEGLTLSEIGDLLLITESRVSQIHTNVLATLRRHLARCQEEDDRDAASA